VLQVFESPFHTKGKTLSRNRWWKSH